MKLFCVISRTLAGKSYSFAEKQLMYPRVPSNWSINWYVSILLYGCTTWTLTKQMEKKLDGNYTRMPQAILNNSWRQHPTKQHLYSHLPPITKTIKVRQTRHARHFWIIKDGLISDALLCISSHGWAKTRRPARTYIQKLCGDTGHNP